MSIQPSASIRKAAVIGTGTMGGQIAAYLTNVGIPVLLLGLVPKGAEDRDISAKNAVNRWLKADPSPFMNPKNIKLIVAGNVEDDLESIKDADWIIEAITENLNLKGNLYRKIDEFRKPGSIISSNTGSIPIAQLVEGQSAKFAQDMIITRFGNPLRKARSMELIMGPDTRKDAAEFIADFCDRRLGKEVVICNDVYGAFAGMECHLYAGHLTGTLILENIKEKSAPVAANQSASLWDIGDEVLCLELHTKLNTIDIDMFRMLDKSISIIKSGEGGKWRGMVVCGSADNFSAGANLRLVLSMAQASAWRESEDFLRIGGDIYRSLRFAPFPTVAAIYGLTLGGGCELALHASAIQAHSETYIGMVEPRIGLVPGWGGCTQMFVRATLARQCKVSDIPPANHVFETVGLSKKSRSASEAVDFQYLGLTDGITMNRDRLLFDAKRKVIELSKGYEPPRPMLLELAGQAGRASLELSLESMKSIGDFSPHDVAVCRSLETILCGEEGSSASSISEHGMMEIERRELMKLIKTPETIARIEYMLERGEPLKN